MPAVTEPETILLLTSTSEEVPIILTNGFEDAVPTFLSVKPLMEGPFVVILKIGFVMVKVVASKVPITVSKLAFLAAFTNGSELPANNAHVKSEADVE